MVAIKGYIYYSTASTIYFALCGGLITLATMATAKAISKFAGREIDYHLKLLQSPIVADLVLNFD